MEHGRGLYSGATNRHLYSGDTGRALYNPVTGWTSAYGTVDELHGVAYYRHINTDVGDTGTKDDVWPEVNSGRYSNWAEGSTVVPATTYWTTVSSSPASTQGHGFVAYERYDVSARSGEKCYGIRLSVYSFQKPTGSGTPYISVQTQSSATADNANAWLEGTHKVEVTGNGTIDFIFPTNITLSDYLFVCCYIEDQEPPTDKDTTSNDIVCRFRRVNPSGGVHLPIMYLLV
jgi:hypothetical protein